MSHFVDHARMMIHRRRGIRVGAAPHGDGPDAATDAPRATEAPGIKVLIVESDASALGLIRRALESDQRFGRVSDVATGDEAVERSLDVDIVVVDLRFVHGLGALGTINRIARRPVHPRIVGLSRESGEWLGMAARCEGADDVLDWPHDRLDLVDRLTRVAEPAYT